jgi:peptidoglycan/xylan/chitin deacetylase (PgdA/CDA1 family)
MTDGGEGLDVGDNARGQATILGKIKMRVAAGLLVAVSLCVPSVAWSQAGAPKPTAAPQAAPAPAPAAAAAAPRSTQPPQPARAACNNPNALGVTRTVEIDTTGGPGFGFEHFKDLDFLKDHEVVLTFDDGPWPGTTAAVLKALADQCTTGVFFQIGKNASDYPDIAKQVYNAGHTVGTHTWSHADLTSKKLTDDQRKDEIERGVSAVKHALGDISPAPFFRFPDLKHPPEMVTYLGTRNIAIFSCDFDSFDFRPQTPQKLVEHVTKSLEKHGKGIILMHDFQKHTAEALPAILKMLKDGGYKVVAMRAKAPVQSLPQYDEEVLKSAKLPTVSQRPVSSVVTDVTQ